MKIIPTAAVAAGLLLGATGAQAGSDTDTWYLGGKAVWTNPDGKRGLDDGYGGQATLGRVLNPNWDIELNAVTSEHQKNAGGKVSLTGGGIDVNRVFYRNSQISTFVGAGFGFMGATSSRVDDGGPYGAIGAGVIGDINRSAASASTLQWRLDAKLRRLTSYGLGSGANDIIVGLGLQMTFGSPEAAATPPPPPAAAPVAPPRPVVVAQPPPPPPLDSDKDGVPDSRDRCPNTPAGDKVDESGCSLRVTLKVLFAFDSAKLMPESVADLDKLVVYLKDSPAAVGVIEGHTDSVGTAKHNLALSQRRADAVKKYVADKGVSAQRLETKGYGETMPAASNATKGGRAENRRAVFQRTDVK